jgi:hypothetical protein
VGKSSTLLQLITLAFALAALYHPGLTPPLILDALVWVTAAATMLSGVQYLYRGFVWLQNQPPTNASNP